MTATLQDGGNQPWVEAHTMDLRVRTGILLRPLNLLTTQPKSLPTSGPLLCRVTLLRLYFLLP